MGVQQYSTGNSAEAAKLRATKLPSGPAKANQAACYQRKATARAKVYAVPRSRRNALSVEEGRHIHGEKQPQRRVPAKPMVLLGGSSGACWRPRLRRLAAWLRSLHT